MSKETFVWTNELLQEWGVFFMKDKTRRPYDELVEAFKQSWVATHPIKKKDYEIVEFIFPRGGKITKNNDNVSWEEWGIKSFDGLTINAVKRSDGEVFEVGEKLHNLLGKDDTNIITKFSIREDGSMWVNGPGFGMNLNDFEKLFPQSKPEQPKKERIDVSMANDSGTQNNRYALFSSHQISNKQFPAIVAAIERVFNDETDCRVSEATLKVIREAEEKAFNAARNTWKSIKQQFEGEYRFPTFQHYLNYKSKEK